MARMIDSWHDLYHANGGTFDLNCPHCQDEFMANSTVDPVTGYCLDRSGYWYDRLEDTPQYERR